MSLPTSISTGGKARKSKSKSKTSTGTKATTRRRSGKRKSSGSAGQRSFAGISSALTPLLSQWSQIALPAAVASGLDGYFKDSDGIRIGPVDARLVIGGLGTAAAVSKVAGSWSGVLQNAATGFLISWLNDQAFGVGAKLKGDSVSVVPAIAEAPAVVQIDTPEGKSNGLVLGNIYDDGSGDLQSRLARKLSKLRKKAEKKDIDWKDVRQAGNERALGKGWIDRDDMPEGGRRVMASPTQQVYYPPPAPAYGVRPGAPIRRPLLQRVFRGARR